MSTTISSRLDETPERPDSAGVSRSEPVGRAQRVCRAWRVRSEVEVLTWGPDRGNPTPKRQGRGSEFTGRFQCGLDGAAELP